MGVITNQEQIEAYAGVTDAAEVVARFANAQAD
jgi:hypothetical protein